jgi:UDP-N-acetylglucosamine 2-epimerase (non-hydrolysing)
LQRAGTDLKEIPVTFLPPLGFFDFVKLELNARCVISDSGTVQEECSIFGVPNITVRDVTERPETVECGSNIISGISPETVLRSLRLVLDRTPGWQPPGEYLVENVSDIVARICLGHYHRSRRER